MHLHSALQALTPMRRFFSSSAPAQIKRYKRQINKPYFQGPRIAAGNPKRDNSPYGFPESPRIDAADIPRLKRANADHPLWQFFHDRQSLPIPNREEYEGQRPWEAFELRRKSFADLHELWYVLLKERNVLLTQRDEYKRIGVSTPDMMHRAGILQRLRSLRKSMARVKQVVHERRLAILEASDDV